VKANAALVVLVALGGVFMLAFVAYVCGVLR
jgi:hypothetical protein